jgi:hypothetical protein
MHNAIISDLKNPVMSDSFEKTYEDAYSWLLAQRIIKVSQEDVPQKFIDGTVLCLLIHRLEGKNCTLGFHSHPKTLSACRTNIKKALEYLRGFPRFKSRYSWSYEEIIRGDHSTVWGLLSDLKKYYLRGQQNTVQVHRPNRPKSAFGRMGDDSANAVKESVKAWLGEMGFSYLLDARHKHFLRDPIRNGVILCKVMGKLTESFEFFSHPRNIEDVWENINASLWAIKNTIKIGRISELIEEDPVWQLLYKIMVTFEPREKIKLPYSHEEIKLLQHSVFKWVFSLKPFDQSLPENFSSLVLSFRTGVVFSRLLEIIFKVSFHYIKFPITEKDFLDNIENCFNLLQKQEKMSKGYLHDASEIVNGNEIYVLALLEDLHRFASGLPARKKGEFYHSDGPFYGKFRNGSLNISNNQPPSMWKSGSVFLSPTRNESVSHLLNVTRTASPFSLYSSFHMKNSVEASFDTISPKEKKRCTENLAGFEWIRKIKVKIPEGFDLSREKISGFRSGEVLCEILRVLESKDFRGVQKGKKGSAQAAKNVAVAFEILRKKPSFDWKLINAERMVLEGNGDVIRMLLREIYRIYQSAIITLIKFNRTG